MDKFVDVMDKGLLEDGRSAVKVTAGGWGDFMMGSMPKKSICREIVMQVELL